MLPFRVDCCEGDFASGKIMDVTYAETISVFPLVVRDGLVGGLVVLKRFVDHAGEFTRGDSIVSYSPETKSGVGWFTIGMQEWIWRRLVLIHSFPFEMEGMVSYNPPPAPLLKIKEGSHGARPRLPRCNRLVFGHFLGTVQRSEFLAFRFRNTAIPQYRSTAIPRNEKSAIIEIQIDPIGSTGHGVRPASTADGLRSIS